MKKKKVVFILVALVMIFTTFNQVIAAELGYGTLISVSNEAAVTKMSGQCACACESPKLTLRELNDSYSMRFADYEIATAHDGSRGIIIDPARYGIEITKFEIVGELSSVEVMRMASAFDFEYILQTTEFNVAFTEAAMRNLEQTTCSSHRWVIVGNAYGFTIVRCLNCGGLFILV